tara:strand:+ start:560 stop:766 length:207 start_codon:yes stop_codon:yes gene_type:complete
MNVQIVIATLQKKISDLTLTNVMLEAQIQDLQSQLNSMNQEQQPENALDGNENQAKEIDDSSDSTDDF